MSLKVLGTWPISAKDGLIVMVPGAIVTFLALYFHCDQVIKPECVHLPDLKSLIAAGVVAAFVVGLLPTAPFITRLWDGFYNQFYRKKDKDKLLDFARSELEKELDTWWPEYRNNSVRRKADIIAHIDTVNIYKWALEQVKHADDARLSQPLTGPASTSQLPGKVLATGLASAEHVAKKDDQLQAISKLCRSLSILCLFGALLVLWLMWPEPNWIIVAGCVVGWVLFASLFFRYRLDATQLAYQKFSELKAHEAKVAGQGEAPVAAPVVPGGGAAASPPWPVF